MNLAFFRYFFHYVFSGPTRQNLIFLAIVGLLISSFSLMVLQGIMGGLQNGLVKRSKTVLGSGYFDVRNRTQEEIDFLISDLKYKKINYISELEIELMIQHGSYLSPMIVHGWDFSTYVPDFLISKDRQGIILGGQLARNLGSYYDSHITLTSPAHTAALLQEIPRQASIEVSDFYSSELPEIDGIHGWVRLSFLQNMIRKRKVNKIRVYSETSLVEEFLKNNPRNFKFISWESMNSTLVWALNLETKVMLFIFVSMSLLIGICIVSGFLIFYNKIKIDLASFWILGLTKKKALKLAFLFGHVLTGIFCLLGVGLGLGFLWLLDSNQLVIMPQHFVERNIPVTITTTGIIISFSVPFVISYLFTRLTFNIFQKEGVSFISLIKRVG